MNDLHTIELMLADPLLVQAEVELLDARRGSRGERHAGTVPESNVTSDLKGDSGRGQLGRLARTTSSFRL